MNNALRCAENSQALQPDAVMVSTETIAAAMSVQEGMHAEGKT